MSFTLLYFYIFSCHISCHISFQTTIFQAIFLIFHSNACALKHSKKPCNRWLFSNYTVFMLARIERFELSQPYIISLAFTGAFRFACHVSCHISPKMCPTWSATRPLFWNRMCADRSFSAYCSTIDRAAAWRICQGYFSLTSSRRCRAADRALWISANRFSRKVSETSAAPSLAAWDW